VSDRLDLIVIRRELGDKKQVVPFIIGGSAASLLDQPSTTRQMYASTFQADYSVPHRQVLVTEKGLGLGQDEAWPSG